MSSDDADAGVAPVFAALDDPTRAHVVGRVAREERLTLTDLARNAPTSRQAISGHVAVLADAGVLASQHHGAGTPTPSAHTSHLGYRRPALAENAPMH